MKDVSRLAEWLCVAVAVSALLSCPAVAAPVMQDSFETYPGGTIEGQGQGWDVVHCTGNVTTAKSHTGYQSLVIDRGPNPYAQHVDWWDDLGLHGGMLEFSWWIYPSTSVGWGYETVWAVAVYGWSGAMVAHLQNDQAGSASTVDAQKSDASWEETMALVPSLQWTQLTLELDFGSSQDQYRIRAGAGPWSSWYTLGSDETYLRRIEFWASKVSYTTYYIDDVSLAPEPATMGLVGLGLAGLVLRRKRK